MGVRTRERVVVERRRGGREPAKVYEARKDKHTELLVASESREAQMVYRVKGIVNSERWKSFAAWIGKAGEFPLGGQPRRKYAKKEAWEKER